MGVFECDVPDFCIEEIIRGDASANVLISSFCRKCNRLMIRFEPLLVANKYLFIEI